MPASHSTSPPSAPPRNNVAALGQVFTPEPVVQGMLHLRRNLGRTLEPSCGDGAFLRHLPQALGIELDSAWCPPHARRMDFFALPTSEKFDTIIGNPPYVRYQDIRTATRKLLPKEGFDQRSNLYLFFIEKCIKHLNPGGELIFITPRDFLKSTSARQLNRWLFERGTITHAIELGDARVFSDAVPNCLIWRFELDNMSRRTAWADLSKAGLLEQTLLQPPWVARHFSECAGHLLFCHGEYPLSLAQIAQVRVGAVSGLDKVFTSEKHGNRDFVNSGTARTGRTRRMIWCEPGEAPPPVLERYKKRLLKRKIRRFGEENWWHWGRGCPRSDAPRVYVNSKTRQRTPVFLHNCPHFDGAVLGVFPHRTDVDLNELSAALNAVDWADLGFVCDGRYLFTQRSLENAPLPDSFRRFLPDPTPV